MIPAQPAVIPVIMYGTAWKEDQTEELVSLAIDVGFRAIDTANQRKHYVEAGVGMALESAIKSGKVKREDIFLQTKFTYVGGQDHRLPYDPNAPVDVQVEQSLVKSFENLKTDYLDAYVLHGPESSYALTPNDWKVWRKMESFVDAGKVRYIGVSNVNARQLSELVTGAKIKPRFVQNRCYPAIGWDPQCREICGHEDLIYQGFSLIRDPLLEASKPVVAAAAKYNCTIPQLVYRWALQSGMMVLAGTSSRQHMEEVLAAEKLDIPEDALRVVGAVRRS